MQDNKSPCLTLYQQMQAVEQLQTRTDIYLNLYEKFIIKQSEDNQFLPNQNIQDTDQSQNLVNEDRKKTDYQQNSAKDNEDVEFEPRKSNLSRIFNQICLGDEVIKNNTHNSINIQLVYQQDQVSMSLGKKDNSYNLSNFSSFNNNRINQDNQQFDIKDLLCLVQQKVGRHLNKAGIQNIVNQIQRAVLSETQRQLKESQITQYSLFHSNINHNTQNNQHLSQLQQYQGKPLQQNKLVLNALHLQQDLQKNNQTKSNKQQHSSLPTKQTKENGNLLYKRKAANVSKQIRIIKKNCFKNSLIMVYSDMKQLQNFCISNKIYGKDKDKIVKAIRQNKNIVSLD